MAFGWKVVYGGRTRPPGEVVRPDERLSWPRTAGLGAQPVVAMFGATFVGDVSMEITDNFTLTGIALGTVVTIVFYHLARVIAPPHLREEGALITVGGAGTQHIDEE